MPGTLPTGVTSRGGDLWQQQRSVMLAREGPGRPAEVVCANGSATDANLVAAGLKASVEL